MGETFPDTAPSVKPPEDRLHSWKEIAAYLNRDVTTVQRWEKREGMPVHRHLHDKLGSVYAWRAELDAWARGRNLPAAPENGDDAPSPSPAVLPPRSAISTSIARWKFVFPLAVVIAALAIGAILWLQRTEYFWRNPIAAARFQTVTDFDGVAEAAAVSRDGHFVAFQSDRDGQMDVWVTQVGSGEFHNLTHGVPRNLSIHYFARWGFHRMVLWLRFGVARRAARAAVTSVSGQCQRWVASRDHILKALPSSTGRTTAPDWCTTRLDPEIRCLFQTAAGNRRVGPSSLRLPGPTVTFRCGRPTMHLSTSSRVPSQTSWTFGASLQSAELPNGLRRTLGA